MSASYEETGSAPIASMRRPRASTSPLLPSLVDDHQVWFDDPRFDGSFPSRVLPFLYLGNLCVSSPPSVLYYLTSACRNHASNAFMLHALGITHVVSVGECALIPPPTEGSTGVVATPGVTKTSSAVVPTGGSGRRGSLYIEEREGRIKVLDIKGVCDDGIDTLEPQLAPICEWMDRAREQGGKVLVHCRVGVSRSATVTIAYVMKYLRISLVEAYLIVPSRRLSVLIQSNMRLLYNLCGWEVKLAFDRAGGNPDRLRAELARCVNWAYLAREVFLLNEKYLHT
jgi:dual specificity MAP kinase phosphatase